METGFILQARMGSTRLPGKMAMPFWNGASIPQIIIRSLKQAFPEMPIILATSDRSLDDPLQSLTENEGIHCFRGSESNVLKRFVDAAHAHQLDSIVRVCADNPFLSMRSMKTLLENADENHDYVSFAFPDGTPVMKSHIGMFAEWVRVSLLESILRQTHKSYYCEHVTTWVYDHPVQSKVKFLPLPEPLRSANRIRLTVDTASDFEYLSELYADLMDAGWTGEESGLMEMIAGNPGLMNRMEQEIDRNAK